MYAVQIIQVTRMGSLRVISSPRFKRVAFPIGIVYSPT